MVKVRNEMLILKKDFVFIEHHCSRSHGSQVNNVISRANGFRIIMNFSSWNLFLFKAHWANILVVPDHSQGVFLQLEGF